MHFPAIHIKIYKQNHETHRKFCNSLKSKLINSMLYVIKLAKIRIQTINNNI